MTLTNQDRDSNGNRNRSRNNTLKQLPPKTECSSNSSIHFFAVAVRLQLRVTPPLPGIKIIGIKFLKNAITYLKSDFLVAVAIIVAEIYCLFWAQNTT